MNSSAEIRGLVEGFVAKAERPCLLDPGEEPMALLPGRWGVREWNGRAVLEAWDDVRSIARKVVRVAESKRDRLCLITERFPKAEGETQIADLAAPAGAELRRKTSRQAFAARFRLLLAREFPAWQLTEVSNEPNLEQSFSPVYTRAFLRMGSQGVAAIAAAPGGDDAAGIVAQGLIWLSFLRRREGRLTVNRLIIYVPREDVPGPALRASFLNRMRVDVVLFGFDESDRLVEQDLSDSGNADSVLPPCLRPHSPNGDGVLAPRVDGADVVMQPDGSARYRVRGLEFARYRKGKLTCGLDSSRRCSVDEAARMALEIGWLRRADAEDRQHPLYTRAPEGWLEAEVRRLPAAVDAGLRDAPVYAQAPVFAAPERDVVDLLGVERTGRLVVIEIKASTDPQLPFQALDYWARVRRHLMAGDFERQGYFPGIALPRVEPRILLVAPALAFHSTTEELISFLAPGIPVTRVGLAEGWRGELRVMFRLEGAARPDEAIAVNE